MTNRKPAEWAPQDEQCLELLWGDWSINYKYGSPPGWYLTVSSGVTYGPFTTLEAAKRRAEDVRGDYACFD
jgi:hypothetical protein